MGLRAGVDDCQMGRVVSINFRQGNCSNMAVFVDFSHVCWTGVEAYSCTARLPAFSSIPIARGMCLSLEVQTQTHLGG